MEVEAITFDELVQHGIENGGNVQDGIPWSFTYKGHGITNEDKDTYLIPTLEGLMKFTRDDMLITGVKGEIYPCKRDIFKATYERVYDAPPVLSYETLYFGGGGTAGPYTFYDWGERSAFIHSLTGNELVHTVLPVTTLPGQHLIFISGGPVACIETKRTAEGEAVYQRNLAATLAGDDDEG